MIEEKEGFALGYGITAHCVLVLACLLRALFAKKVPQALFSGYAVAQFESLDTISKNYSPSLWDGL